MQAWGWRIPLLVGCAIIPFLFVIRRSLQETEAFLARTHRLSAGEIMRSMVANWQVVGLGMMMVIMTTVSFYLITAYTPTFGKNELHLDDASVLVVTVCVGLSNLFWLPVSGALSDRIGRKPILIGTTVLAIVTAYPVMRWLVASPSFSHLLVAELWLQFPVRLLQRRNGRVFDRGDAGQRAHGWLLLGIQPGDRRGGDDAGDLHGADPVFR